MENEIKEGKVKYQEPTSVKIIMYVFFVTVFFFLAIILLFFLQSCTLSFQNISTHGTATDLVDEDQTASPKTDANIPISLTSKP